MMNMLRIVIDNLGLSIAELSAETGYQATTIRNWRFGIDSQKGLRVLLNLDAHIEAQARAVADGGKPVGSDAVKRVVKYRALRIVRNRTGEWPEWIK